jgi:hypothetical protein
MVKYKVFYVESDVQKSEEYNSDKPVGEIHEDFSKGSDKKVWRVDILENDLSINPETTIDERNG